MRELKRSSLVHLFQEAQTMKSLRALLLISLIALIARFIPTGPVAGAGGPVVGPSNIKTSRAGWKDNPWINFKDASRLPAKATVKASGRNDGRGLAMASADFDEDGRPDVVAAYDNGGTGVLSLHRVNSEGLGAVASSFSVPLSPDFIAAGDFDADGHFDIVAASRNSETLYLLAGDGKGNLLEPEAIAMPGAATAMASGEINRADGLADLVVGVEVEGRGLLLMYESPVGALKDAPEIIQSPAAVTALAVGQIDDGYEYDIAAAAGEELLIVHGRDRRLSWAEEWRNRVEPPKVERRKVNSSVIALAVGDFSGDHSSELALLSTDGRLQVWERAGGAGKTKEQPVNQEVVWRQSSLAVADGNSFQATSSLPRLFSAKISSLPKQDLMILDSSNRRLTVVANDAEAAESSALLASLDLEGAPVAALPVRINEDAISDIVVLREGAASLSVMVSAPVGTFTVTNTNDAGNGSLRKAINDANGNPGLDTINFNIPGTGEQEIQLNSTLPVITGPVVINGYSQPGSSVNTLANGNNAVLKIVLDGAPDGFAIDGLGLDITGGGSTVRGLKIQNFANLPSTGIQLRSNGNNIVEGNYIVGNRYYGVYIDNCSGNTIGGTTAAARNTISDHPELVSGGGVSIAGSAATGNIIQGNFIGTNTAGTAALANYNGVIIGNCNNNTVGGTAAGARNIISGNRLGVRIYSYSIGAVSNIVQGNYIGLNSTGAAAIPNITAISLSEDLNEGGSIQDTLIGGTTVAARNVVSGNTIGIEITTVSSSGTPVVVVQGNYVGTNPAGTAAIGNIEEGIIIREGTQLIGGGIAGAGNLISGNKIGVKVDLFSSSQIQGNLIGTNGAGDAAIGNTEDGVFLNTGAGSITVGGSSAATRNIISGNGQMGVRIHVFTGGHRVSGNYIGLNAAGTAAIPNRTGVLIDSDCQDVLIGGSAASERNIISGNIVDGVRIKGDPATGNGTSQNTVRGNYIGTDPTGTAAIPNGFNGVVIAGSPDNLVEGNVISGNTQNGIGIGFGGATDNRVYSNLIGTQPNGLTALANGQNGILITQCDGNQIGGGASNLQNIIAFNALDGVNVDSGVGNSISYNRIFSNGGLGIDLSPGGVTANDAGDADTGANNLQNFPVLTSVTTSGSFTNIAGTLNSTANTTFTIDFYRNTSCDTSNNGEGESRVGHVTVTTDASGNATINATGLTAVPVGQVATAVAIDPNGNTSEFSACRAATAGSAGTLQLSAATYNSNETGPNAIINVTRTGGSFGAVTVNYATTTGGTATDGTDYTGTTGTLTWANGDTANKTFSFPIINDTLDETDETINLALSNATGGATLGSPSTAVLTILDNDNPPNITINNVSVTEGNSGTVNAVFTISLSAASGRAVSVNYATGDNTATQPSDYTSLTGSHTFTAGQTTKTVTVAVKGDTEIEPNETFFVILSGATNGTITDSQGVGTITNDDTCSFSINPTSRNHTSVAGSGSITVTTSAGCAWTASESLSWVSITSGASGTGNGSVNYSVTANTGPTRSGSITVAGQTFSVSQDSGCSFSISPSYQSFAANASGGTITITAPAGCAWAASESLSWVSITTGFTGIGNGSVSFTVAQNTSASIRSGTITAAGQTFTVYQGIQFADVSTSHLFYTEIGKLSARGITLGCGSANYCPDSTVTREQMAAFIIRSLGEFNPPPPTSQRFADVPATNPFYGFIDRMAVLGITSGCGGGNYCPTSPVLREQMAAFIIRALGEFSPPPPASQRFADVPATNPFYAFIDRMGVLGITSGCGGGNYCPAAAVTRGQMAVFLVRAFNL
jgi:parallel beta-helix repeat protein